MGKSVKIFGFSFILLFGVLCHLTQIASSPLQLQLYKKVKSKTIIQENENALEERDGIPTYMYGSINVTFEFFAAIEIGSEKQLFTVQVDTGSSGLAVPAKGCTEHSKSDGHDLKTPCPHADDFYDISKSSTGKTLNCGDFTCDSCSNGKCGFTLQYGDGSFVGGTVSKDVVYMSGLSATVEFGSIVSESEGFENTGVDGIIGFAYQKLDQGLGSVFDSFVREGQCKNSFAMCLGTSGGILVLGGINDSYNAGPMVYTPIIEETYYVVQAEDLTVDGQSLDFQSKDFGTTIVDSGTTFLILPNAVFDKLITSLISHCPSELKNFCSNPSGQTIFTPGLCIKVDQQSVLKFPNIGILLYNITEPLVLSPRDYFLQLDEYFCFGIAGIDGSIAILGDVFMQKYNVYFDREQKQIGFAPVQNCEGSPTVLTLISGNEQSGSAGFKLSEPLVVNVQYENQGIAATGAIVEFKVVSGSAELSNPRGAVNPDGTVSTTLKVKKSGTIQIEAATVGLSSNKIVFTIHGKVWAAGIAIGVIGSCVFISLIAVIAFYCYRRRKNKLGNKALYFTVNQNPDEDSE